MLFPLGTVVITQGVNEKIPEEDYKAALNRHASGDWGEVCKTDFEINNRALKRQDSLFSKYTASNGIAFYIITEWDRSVTTILLPSEY